MRKLPLNNVITEFTDNNMVKIKYNTDNGTTIKTITFNEYCKVILASRQENKKKKDKYEETPVLPGFGYVRTIKYRKYSDGIECIFLSREAASANITYFETEYKNVGIPKLVFMVKMFKKTIQELYVCAVKDEIIADDTQIYYYPFSNVFSDCRVCFGANNIASLDMASLVNLHSVPSLFLAIPNNDDEYGNNLSGLDYRPLLKKLQDKPFNDDWLKPMNRTFKKWL